MQKQGFRIHRDTTIGTPPGTLRADPNASRTTIRLIAYDGDKHEERQISDVNRIEEYLNRWPVIWVDVSGLSNVKAIQRIGEIFRLHQLALEDVVNGHQRAKVEQYDTHFFVVARTITLETAPHTEQLSLFFGKNFVLTFQEGAEKGSLDTVRERIRRNVGLIRHGGVGYLVYSLLDAVIDGYFPVVESYGDRLDMLETEVIERPSNDMIRRIHSTKREMLSIRRAIWPLQEALHSLLLEAPAFTNEARIYLRDAYDHTLRIIELVEIHRELGSDLMAVYLSTLSNRTNEIMRVLTVIATIFIPLTFITGIYGMNFDTDASAVNMPELGWALGYPLVLVLMLGIAGGMLYYFWRRGWLSSPNE